MSMSWSSGFALVEQGGPEGCEAAAPAPVDQCVEDSITVAVSKLGRQGPDREGSFDALGGVVEAVAPEPPDQLDRIAGSHGDAGQVDVVPPVHADRGVSLRSRIQTPRKERRPNRGATSRRRAWATQDPRVAPETPDSAVDAEECLPDELRGDHNTPGLVPPVEQDAEVADQEQRSTDQPEPCPAARNEPGLYIR
jgi:hypothetical protein